jgi:hypothetical protein
MSKPLIRPFFYKVRHKAKFSMRALLWADLTEVQKAQAVKKYFNGEGTPEDYFTCEPDGFLIIDGVIYDVDAEATANIDFESPREALDVSRENHQLRLLPSSVKRGKGLVIHYCNECDPVYQVYSVEVANV